MLAAVHPAESSSRQTSVEAICDHQLDFFRDIDDESTRQTDVKENNENLHQHEELVEAINIGLRNDFPILLINDQPLLTSNDNHNNKVSN